MFNSQYLYLLIGPLTILLGLLLSLYGIITWIISKYRLTKRVEHFVSLSEDEFDPASNNQIIQREISGNLFERTIVKWLKNFVRNLEKFTPTKMALNLEHKLILAGNPSNLHAGDFNAIRLLLVSAAIVLVVIYLFNQSALNPITLLLGILIVAIFYALPNVWLSRKIRERQGEIQKTLPDALDMLSVCASAGLGFDQSLQKISYHWETELGTEIKRVTHEMEMGISRMDALRNLSNRMDVDDLSRFVAIIIQAEKVGMSYADVLHSQALQLRVLRQFRAREIANKLPGKMIIPLAVCILPALLAVILGPMIPIILNIF